MMAKVRRVQRDRSYCKRNEMKIKRKKKKKQIESRKKTKRERKNYKTELVN